MAQAAKHGPSKEKADGDEDEHMADETVPAAEKSQLGAQAEGAQVTGAQNQAQPPLVMSSNAQVLGAQQSTLA